MPKVLTTLRGDGEKAPTVDEVIQRYGIRPEQIDANFGVVEVDPSDRLYSVLVDPAAAAQIGGKQPGGFAGPYSNPEIGTFGFKSR